MNPPPIRRFCAWLPLAAAFLAGCVSSPAPRLYVAAPDGGWRDVAVRDALQSDCSVRFAPVRLAAYLDVPQIVTRLSPNEIRADAFNRWGMPLETIATEIVASAAALRLPRAFVDVSTGRTLPAPGYLVQIEILRLDGPLGGPVELVAHWQVLPADDPGRPLARQIVRHSRPATAATYEAYVQAIRLVLDDLAADVAGAIQAARP